MTHLEMVVHYRDGHTQTKTERNDAIGRVRIDKAAFAEMARDAVSYVFVRPVVRRTQEGGERRGGQAW